MSFVILEMIDQVGVLTLNRPERRNALSTEIYDDLTRYLLQLEADESCVCAIITGAGTAFSSGGDVKKMAERSSEPPSLGAAKTQYRQGAARAAQAVYAFAKPLLAAVNGAAAGAGCSLALMADIRLASSTATFSLPFVKRGLMPDWGATFLLPQIVGMSKSLELAFTGEPISADEALRIGLVSAILPPDDLLDACIGLGRKIGENAPLALRETKAGFRRSGAGDLAEALKAEESGQARLKLTDDHREGVKAFLEKRAPEFRGS